MPDELPAGQRDELRPHLRSERLDLDRTVALRGGPDTLGKLRQHAARTHRAFELDGLPVHGVSVFCALDDIGPGSLDGLLASRLVTYRWVYTPKARLLAESGFTLLATFARPHYTLLLDEITDDTLERLQDALGQPTENPYHRRGRILPTR